MKSKSREKITSLRQFYKGVCRFKEKIESDFLPARQEEEIRIKAIEKKIINEVEKEYQIPYLLILQHKKESIRAKTMLLILLARHSYFTHQEIANKLKVTPSLISYRIRAFDAVLNKNGSGKQISDNKIFYEDGFMKRYRAMDRIITKYKRSLWQN